MDQVGASLVERTFAHPDAPCDGRGKLGRRKIADDQRFSDRGYKIVGSPAQRLDGEKRHENTGIEVKTHLHSSSRIWRTSVAASVLAGFRPTRRARSHSSCSSTVQRGVDVSCCFS